MNNIDFFLEHYFKMPLDNLDLNKLSKHCQTMSHNANKRMTEQ